MSISSVAMTLFMITGLYGLGMFAVHIAKADTVADLQAKIDARSADIRSLEQEIANYQKQIDGVSGQVNSLSATIKSLDLSLKKIQANISLTENRIANKTYEIQQLSSEIGEQEENVADDKRIISQSLLVVNQRSDQSLIEKILASESVSSAWNSMDQLARLNSDLVSRINSLKTLKAGLEKDKTTSENDKKDLESLNKQLKDQKQVVLATQDEKNQLLADTKQSEVRYRAILAQKQSQKEALDREVLQYESQLKLAIDASKLPTTGQSVLSWPTDNVFITQFFGNTPFATANAQIYGGKGHNGIDLRASIGTPIKAALSGRVVGVANTDSIKNCYSYGKWVMIDHGNGLSTLYAHMSVQGVSVGDIVGTGEIIGYSGNTGYTTGPHLHFGVYATQGVQIAKLTKGQSIHCTGATIPLADFKAYLNPLSYLPKYND